MDLWTFYKLVQRIVTREFIDFRHSTCDDDSLVMVLGCWASVCSARDSRIGDWSRDSPRFRPPSTSTAIGSRYERRSVALDHARVLEEVGSEDRMRREALCQKLLEEGSVLWERRCCTGREYFFTYFLRVSISKVGWDSLEWFFSSTGTWRGTRMSLISEPCKFLIKPGTPWRTGRIEVFPD